MMYKKLHRWWHLNRIWDPAEVKFRRKLKLNSLYPFHEEKDAFVMEVRNFSLYIGLSIFMIAGIGGPIYWYRLQKFSNELFDTMFVLLFLWSLRLISYNWQKRRICIEKDGQNYFFYIGNSLQFCGEIHNIYLRLRGQQSSNGHKYYRLVINGFNVEEQEITSMTTNKQVLEKLAKRLAFRLNINYFDSDDISVGHIVRHTNPKTFVAKASLPSKKPLNAKRVSIARATLDAFY
ncbi:unnamed protein product [Clavelina lepadiformis]|uniref:Uncharacterized protein n=1 Tax=Clavelina lepadiformis TaxID=159417 RepID=A0ABP0F4W6_CLALP